MERRLAAFHWKEFIRANTISKVIKRTAIKLYNWDP